LLHQDYRLLVQAAVAGISIMKAVTVAGLTAVAAVVEKLARGFMNDGKLDMDEINAAFAAVDVNSKTAADLQVEAKQTGQDIVISAQGGTSSCNSCCSSSTCCARG
jgi:hypothetical protein